MAKYKITFRDSNKSPLTVEADYFEEKESTLRLTKVDEKGIRRYICMVPLDQLLYIKEQ